MMEWVTVGMMKFPTVSGKSIQIPWFQSPPTRKYRKINCQCAIFSSKLWEITRGYTIPLPSASLQRPPAALHSCGAHGAWRRARSLPWWARPQCWWRQRRPPIAWRQWTQTADGIKRYIINIILYYIILYYKYYIILYYIILYITLHYITLYYIILYYIILYIYGYTTITYI